MMQTAPAAPSAPAIVAAMRPLPLKPESEPCDESATTGISTPIRKYATPTHSSAFNGLPSCIWPTYNSAPYAPHESTAPATKITHPIRFLADGPVVTAVAMVFGRL